MTRRVRPLGNEADPEELRRDAKLAVVREAAKWAFPTADIGQMLAELEQASPSSDPHHTTVSS